MWRRLAYLKSLVLCCALWLHACLPQDTRATPGTVTVTVAGTPSTAGFVTSDGWRITYRRLLAVVGEVELSGDGCDPYNENDYTRVVDAVEPLPQRLSTIYALGACELGFRVRPPRWSTILGVGVRESDALALRTPASDAYADDAGASVLIEGSAEKLGTVKRFAWTYRHFVVHERCATGEPPERLIRLVADREIRRELIVQGEVPFLGNPHEPGLTRFEPYRGADDEHGDGNGDITLEELRRTPPDEPDAEEALWQNLGDRLYLGLLPTLVRFEGSGACEVSASAEEPDNGDPF